MKCKDGDGSGLQFEGLINIGYLKIMAKTHAR